MSEQQPGESLVIRVPPASCDAGTDTGVSPEPLEDTDGVD